jgi:hypothetical protein
MQYIALYRHTVTCTVKEPQTENRYMYFKSDLEDRTLYNTRLCNAGETGPDTESLVGGL